MLAWISSQVTESGKHDNFSKIITEARIQDIGDVSTGNRTLL